MPSRRNRLLIVLTSLVLLGLIGTAAAVLLAERGKQTERAIAMTRGDPDRAMPAIVRYGCAACHAIPGAQVPGGLAAAPLSGITDRLYLGGVVENSPANLVRWIVNPKQFNPRTAMPVTGISEKEARDVAAYFYRQR
jgi:cytochrome c1